MKYTFIPDYENVQELYLVSPYLVRKEKEYWDEFINFLLLIKENITRKLIIKIICNSEEAKEYTFNELLNHYKIHNDLITLEFQIILVSDVWIRDYFSCGNIIDDCGGNSTCLKATYSPSYNSYYAHIDDAAGYRLASINFPNYKSLPFKLDGGNVICNDEFIICSERIFTENIDICSKKELERYFEINFEQKLITIPVENLDVVGHADSIVRFLNKRTLLLPMYPTEYRVDNRYIIKIKNLLREKMGVGYNFEYLPCYLSDELNDDNIFSAEGIYLNYLKIDNVIFFPGFKGDDYYRKEIKNKIEKINKELKCVFVEIPTYALQGGCLNCITNAKITKKYIGK